MSFLKDLEDQVIKILDKRYTRIFASYDTGKYSSIWDILVEHNFLTFHLPTFYNGYSLGDTHCKTMLSKYAQLKSMDNSVLDKLYMLDLLTQATEEIDKEQFDRIARTDYTPIIAYARLVDGVPYLFHQYLGVYPKVTSNIHLCVVLEDTVAIYELPLHGKALKVHKITIMKLPYTTVYLSESCSINSLEPLIRVDIPLHKVSFCENKYMGNLLLVALSLCEVNLNYIKKRITTRKQFGRRLSDYQALRFRYARLYAQYQLLACRVAGPQPLSCTPSTMARVSELLAEIIQSSIHLSGAFGLLEESDAAFYYKKGSMIKKILQQMIERHE